MATQAKEATAKGVTATPSNESKLRKSAPQVRTAAAIVEKHEQILDGLEREAISGKIAEQMGQQLKGITGIARLEMQFWNTVIKFGRKAPVPRSALMRSVLGLPETISPTDGETVRSMLPDAR